MKLLILLLLFSFNFFEAFAKSPKLDCDLVIANGELSSNPIDNLILSIKPESFVDSKLIDWSIAEKNQQLLASELEILQELEGKGYISNNSKDKQLLQKLIDPLIAREVFMGYLRAMLEHKGYSHNDTEQALSEFHNFNFIKQIELVHDLLDYMAYNLPTETGLGNVSRLQEVADTLSLDTTVLGNFIEMWNLISHVQPKVLFLFVDKILSEYSESTPSFRSQNGIFDKLVNSRFNIFNGKKDFSSLISAEPPVLKDEVSVENIINGKSVFEFGFISSLSLIHI